MAGNAAAIENGMAAGDSAGCGLPAGGVPGAGGGRAAAPDPRLSGRAAAQEITRRPAHLPTGGGACGS